MDSEKPQIKPNVLIVDDNETSLFLLTVILKPLDINLIQAMSGHEAIAKIKEKEIALALLDINMPQLNGVELASKIQNDEGRDKIPIIFITAYARNEIELERLYDSGVVDFIQKPFKKNILRSKVEIFLELWRQKQKLKEQKLSIEQTANDLKEQTKSLNKRLAYENLLSRISVMAVSMDSLDDFMASLLHLIGETLNLCRSCIFKHQHKTNTMNLSYEWCNDGVDPLKEVFRDVDCSGIPNWINTLKNLEIHRFSDVNDIPDKRVRKELCRENVKSVLAIPLFFGNNYDGFIGFNYCSGNREWADEEIEFLLSISKIIMTVTERKQFEEVLKQTQLLLKSSLESPKNIIIASIDKNYSYLYFNKAHKLFIKNSYNIDIEVGMNILDCITKEKDREDIKNNFDITLLGNTLVTTQVLGDTKRKIFENSYNPIQNDKNEIVGITFFVQDITKRKLAEEELKDSLKQAHQLTKYIEKVREQERVTIARELHDDLGQALTAIKIDLGIIRHNIKKEDIVQRIIKTEVLASNTIKTVQRITFQLRPKIVDDLGLEAGIEWYISEFSERNNIKVSLDIGSKINVSPDVSIVIYRIMQESLTNVVRHAKATRVDIELNQKDNCINFVLSDNGIGISEKQLKSKISFGIIGMRERAASFGGKLELFKNSIGGTSLELTIPLNSVEN